MGRLISLVFAFLLIPSICFGATFYYIDPTYTGGSNDGTLAHPWLRLDQAAQWDVLDTALASDSVTVYFSARIVASDTAESTTTRILLLRTDASTNLLTLDGNSKYNPNDSGGDAWLAYTGTNRFTVNYNSAPALYTEAATYPPTTKRNYITVRGIKFIADNDGQAVLVGGDHLTITDCEITQVNQGGTTSGGGLALGYAYVGDTIWYGSCDTITFSNNIVHNVGGEGIYIGGSGDGNHAAHTNITISGNTVYDVGDGYGEHDGIDVKDANTNVTISNNIVYLTTKPGTVGDDVQGDGINTMSPATIERNFIYNFPRGGIVLDEFYDTYGTGRSNGTNIRNNIIVDCGGGDTSTNENGITVYIISRAGASDNWNNVNIYNNSIYGIKSKGGGTGDGIRLVVDGADTVIGYNVINNIVSQCAGTEFNAESGFTIDTHDYNNYYDTSGNIYQFGATTVAYDGNLAAQEANSIKTDPTFVSTDLPYAASNFRIQTSSGAKDAGTTIAGFTNDYAGITRPQGPAWDIGAYEYVYATHTGVTFSGGVSWGPAP